MTDGAMDVPPSEQSAPRARRLGIARPCRLLVLALAGTALISALLVIPGWVPTLSRPVRRELTEVILQTVLVAYAAIVIIALCGVLSLAWLLARSFRRHSVRPGIARLFLAGAFVSGRGVFSRIGRGRLARLDAPISPPADRVCRQSA